MGDPNKRIRVNCPDSKAVLIRVNSFAQIYPAIAKQAEACGAKLPAEYKLVLLPHEFREEDWPKLSANKEVTNELTLESADVQPRHTPQADAYCHVSHRQGPLRKARKTVQWADTWKQEWFVETEFGLPADATERERRAYIAGLERSKRRREAEAKGARVVSRKPEGKGHLCAPDEALPRAEKIASEVQLYLAE